MSSPQYSLVQKFIDKFSNSRDFTISLLLHAILVTVFGTTVLFQAVKEPADFEGDLPGPAELQVATPPLPDNPPMPANPNMVVPDSSTQLTTITTVAPPSVDFAKAPMTITRVNRVNPSPDIGAAKPTPISPDGLSAAQASAIRKFTESWKPQGPGSGPGKGNRIQEFEFVAYLGQYSGGDWNSTVQVSDGKIVNGSLPNLLYFMQNQSKNKIKTNYTQVQAIKLDSDELFSAKPPFVLLTGTRDFRLSDTEVENLQKYILLGGAIWGDSSVPGRNSRFDIAFRREMKRVIPDVDKTWEALPPDHPIFRNTYFTEVKEVPPGLNYYREPIYALKIYGEVAIIYTPNDYGDMWQVGLQSNGEMDARRNDKGQFVAINDAIWNNRGTYLRNIAKDSLTTSYKFGTNVVIHLLTRWEDKTRSAASL